MLSPAAAARALVQEATLDSCKEEISARPVFYCVGPYGVERPESLVSTAAGRNKERLLPLARNREESFPRRKNRESNSEKRRIVLPILVILKTQSSLAYIKLAINSYCRFLYFGLLAENYLFCSATYFFRSMRSRCGKYLSAFVHRAKKGTSNCVVVCTV